MLSVLSEWLNLILRWAHIMLGIGWIGASFFFIWLDQSLRKRDGQAEGIAGESWMVPGGGFYRVDKCTVAPETLPKELHWFKHEALFTFITGFLLMVVIYYFAGDAFRLTVALAQALIEPDEKEARADPADAEHDLGPAQDQVQPFEKDS